MTKPGDYLRLLIPVDRLDDKQRARAVALGDRIEAKVAAMLGGGADVDRLLAWVEAYFPEG